MKAITGFVVSTKPCSLGKAARILERFSDSAASHLPSSDCATFLQTAAVATHQHHIFRRDLRANHQQGAINLYAHEDEVPESDRKHRDRARYGDMAVPAGGSHDSASEPELAVPAGEKKGKKRKKKEDPQEDRTVAGVALHSPTSWEIATEKRKKKKKGEHSNEEIASDVKQEAGLVAEVELASEEKGKKKNVKDHVKLEEDVGDVKEGKGQLVNNGVTGQGVAGAEKKRKKKKHAEEQGYVKDVKEEEETVADGDLDCEKKRKKKRGRGEDDDQEQTKHSKKQRKQS